MNGMNERTPESDEYKRQLHLRSSVNKSRARLSCETKEQHQLKLQPRRKARKRREQSRRTEEASKIERVSRKPATSFTETTSAKTSKAWTCAGGSKILLSVFVCVISDPCVIKMVPNPSNLYYQKHYYLSVSEKVIRVV